MRMATQRLLQTDKAAATSSQPRHPFAVTLQKFIFNACCDMPVFFLLWILLELLRGIHTSTYTYKTKRQTHTFRNDDKVEVLSHSTTATPRLLGGWRAKGARRIWQSGDSNVWRVPRKLYLFKTNKPTIISCIMIYQTFIRDDEDDEKNWRAHNNACIHRH